MARAMTMLLSREVVKAWKKNNKTIILTILTTTALWHHSPYDIKSIFVCFLQVKYLLIHKSKQFTLSHTSICAYLSHKRSGTLA